MVAFRELKSFIGLLFNAHMSFMWGNNGGRGNYGGYGAPNAALAPGAKDERPPGWSPEIAHDMPLRKYIQQLKLWQLMTKVDEEKHGIAIFRELGGLAQEQIQAQIDVHGFQWLMHTHAQSQLAHPHNDPYAQPPIKNTISSVNYIILLLNQVWGPDEQQMNLTYLRDFFKLHWEPREALDSYMLRQEMVYDRCRVTCGLQLNSVARCYMLIQQLHLRPEDLLELLRHTQGNLPRNDDEFLAFKRNLLSLKRVMEPHKFTRGHLALCEQEAARDSALNTYQRHGSF